MHYQIRKKLEKKKNKMVIFQTFSKFLEFLINYGEGISPSRGKKINKMRQKKKKKKLDFLIRYFKNRKLQKYP